MVYYTRFYVLPCAILFLYFPVLLALRLPRLGKSDLILVLFVRSFDLCLFRFVGVLFLLCLGRAAVCDCGTPWTFLLPFLVGTMTTSTLFLTPFKNESLTEILQVVRGIIL